MSTKGNTVVDYEIPGYRVLQRVGDGNSAVVYQVQRCHANCESSGGKRPLECTEVAKVIPRRYVTAATRREVELHLGVKHANIVRLRRVVAASHMASGEHAVALVMDYACAGDMFAEVSSAGSLLANVARRRLADIVAALVYLHEQQRMAHLDVKLENVVITKSSTAQLIDFGCARHLENPPCTSTPRTPLGGTLHYLPPELVTNGNAAPTTAMDAWALGVLLYTALVGSYPFSPAVEGSHASNLDEREEERLVKERIVTKPPHPFPPYVSVPSDLRHIVWHLLEKNPSRRMTVQQVAANLQITASVTASLRAPLLSRPSVASPASCLTAVRATSMAGRRQQRISVATDDDIEDRIHLQQSAEGELEQPLLSALRVVDALLSSSGASAGLQTAIRSRSSHIDSILKSCSSDSTHASAPPEPQAAL